MEAARVLWSLFLIFSVIIGVLLYTKMLKETKETIGFIVIIFRAGQVRKLVRKSANPQLRTNEKSCGHADFRTLAV